MKSILGCAAAILVVCPSLASACEPPVVTGPDEMVLHIEASGTTTDPADLITITVPIQTTGQTAIAARAANQAAIARFKAALKVAGIDPAAVSMKPPSSFGFIGNMSTAEDDGAASMTLLNQAQTRSANSMFDIRLSDPSQMTKVTAVLDEQNLAMVGGPRSSLVDDRAAKDRAIANAIANVRKEAESYAKALGVTIKRIVRVSSNCNLAANDYGTMMERWANMWGGSASGFAVVTQAVACVDAIAVSK